MSSPTEKEQLVKWRLFIESAYALIDILGSEMQTECGGRSTGTTRSSTSRRPRTECG